MDITDDQIESLQQAAGRAGDTMQAALCRIAIGSDADEVVNDLDHLTTYEAAHLLTFNRRSARSECERQIAAARAMGDE